VPFVHFFDGFRTSHEVSKIEVLSDDQLRSLMPEDEIAAHRLRALTPDRPVLRGTAQNPDTFFQAREAGNIFYEACPGIVEAVMTKFAALTGRSYGLFEYAGDPHAERVIVIMGSGAETARETIDVLTARGEKVGLLRVNLFRPFSAAAFLRALPQTVRGLAVMDRTKEPGALGDPLYQDVVTAIAEARAEGFSLLAGDPVVIAGRYGLSSKEFTPAMVKAVLDHLAQPRPRNHVTVGIVDDVTHSSLACDESFRTESDDVTTALFYGTRCGRHGRRQQELDQDHRRGDCAARAGLLRLRLEEVRRHDRLAPAHEPEADPVGISDQPGPLRRLPPVRVPRPSRRARARRGRARLPAQRARPATRSGTSCRARCSSIMSTSASAFYAIDASASRRRPAWAAASTPSCRPASSPSRESLPRDEAIAQIKKAIEKTYASAGRRSSSGTSTRWTRRWPTCTSRRAGHGDLARARAADRLAEAPDFVQKVTAVLLAGKGDLLPVSAFPSTARGRRARPSGRSATSRRRSRSGTRRSASSAINARWSVPHAAIRAKVYDAARCAGAPDTFKSTAYKGSSSRASRTRFRSRPRTAPAATCA
jgi:pyruvate-ferredoxin/flavodoxin oxidoreductase